MFTSKILSTAGIFVNRCDFKDQSYEHKSPKIKKQITWGKKTTKKYLLTADETYFYRYTIEKTPLTHKRLKKIKIKIPIIKYIEHIKKHFNDKPFNLKIDLYTNNDMNNTFVTNKTMKISTYYIHIDLVVDISLNTFTKIYLSIYMIDRLKEWSNDKYNHMDDLFDWTYEFYKISDLLISKTKYLCLKNNYLKADMKTLNDSQPEKDNEQEDIEYEEDNEHNKEDIGTDSDDLNEIKNKLTFIGNNCDTSVIFQSHEDMKEKYIDDLGDFEQSSKLSILTPKEAYLITDFFFDIDDIIDDIDGIVTLMDFFTRSYIQYIIN